VIWGEGTSDNGAEDGGLETPWTSQTREIRTLARESAGRVYCREEDSAEDAAALRSHEKWKIRAVSGSRQFNQLCLID